MTPHSEFQRVGRMVEKSRRPGSLRVGVVRSIFRSELTESMLSFVQKRSEKLSVLLSPFLLARGALETPLLAQRLLALGGVDGVVVLAAVVKGKTKHDEVVVQQATRALVEISLRYNKPIGIGIIGPGVTNFQAKKRSQEYAQGALDAVVFTTAQIPAVINGSDKTNFPVRGGFVSNTLKSISNVV